MATILRSQRREAPLLAGRSNSPGRFMPDIPGPVLDPSRRWCRQMKRIRTGAVCWILCLQYFAAEAVAIAGWRCPYSVLENYISDLGAVICAGRLCSPLHAMMNASFVLQGVLISAGAVLVWPALLRRWSGSLGLGLVAASGLGVFIVGLAPEDFAPGWHYLGAAENFLFSNAGAALLGLALLRQRRSARRIALFSLAAGLLGLAGLVSLATQHYFGLGVGGMERVTAYPFPLWLASMGAWLLRGAAGEQG
jgi:hypothetical membrane protein